MLSRGHKDKEPKLLISDYETFIHSNLLNDCYQIYGFYESCLEAEEIIQLIVNEAKKVYLEGDGI